MLEPGTEIEYKITLKSGNKYEEVYLDGKVIECGNMRCFIENRAGKNLLVERTNIRVKGEENVRNKDQDS